VYDSNRLNAGSLLKVEDIGYGFDISNSSYNSNDDTYDVVPYYQRQDYQLEVCVCVILHSCVPLHALLHAALFRY
jgi:hypothetical protein